MAQDIVPIELGLTEGDLVTLWAPRWREAGEEWEAFLGHEEDLYAFPDAAHLAAFVRTVREHDLAEHPAWHTVPELTVGELMPDDNHQFDLIGVPELAAEDPDTWTVGELADIIAIVRSLADVCELDTVIEILDSVPGFALLSEGTLAFSGRDGAERWTQLSEAIAERWDEVLDAIDDLITTPEVDAEALAKAVTEIPVITEDAVAAEESDDEDEATATEAEPEPSGFWVEVGIDPVKITTTDGEFYTLRCYLDDEPVFLGSGGRIDVFSSPRALAKWLAEPEDAAGNDLAEVSTWQEVLTAAIGGDLEIEVLEDNVYVLAGIDEDIEEGPDAVDPTQLELAVELLEDAAEWAGDKTVAEALLPSETLGWLVSFVLRPDPTRLAPSSPYDAERTSWQQLVIQFEDRLREH